ncbi:DUF2851 family protein [Bacteroidota bacterium]
MDIKEDLLYYIWQYRLFKLPLLDMDDLKVELVDPGLRNRDSGPDFFNARVRSGKILWAGNVEIHGKASEWYQHGHHLDPAFNNVILHVVLDPDCQVNNSRGRKIRTVKMEIDAGIHYRAELLTQNPDCIPCWRDLHLLDQGRISRWLDRLLVERLEERAARITAELNRCAWDWEEVIYRTMARAFGQKTNADPFEMLARSVSRKQILKFCPDQISKEAILFGQAGMLENSGKRDDSVAQSGLATDHENDEYFNELCQRYRLLQHNLRLRSIDGFLWKFLRLRPGNFPTIRISQFANILELYPDLFTRLINQKDPVAFVMKMDIRASEYWNSHYRFHRDSHIKEKKMGKGHLQGMLINAILPVLYTAKRHGKETAFALDIPAILAQMPPEDNHIIRVWKSLGREVPSGYTSQALLQLTNKNRKFKTCLSCYAGSQIIQSSKKKI